MGMKTIASVVLICMTVFTAFAQAPKTFKSIEDALRKPDDSEDFGFARTRPESPSR
jgi:hypothetical protein